MKKFKFLQIAFYLSLFVILTACDSSSKESKEDLRICPQCNMELPKSNIHTSTINQNGDMHYFDDVGCMILWAKDENIDLKSVKTEIFSNDTKKYIDTFKAFYKINERTPMLYGFSAYEKPQDGSIDFDEVIIRMLRGEHMANPKIRKQILGY